MSPLIFYAIYSNRLICLPVFSSGIQIFMLRVIHWLFCCSPTDRYHHRILSIWSSFDSIKTFFGQKCSRFAFHPLKICLMSFHRRTSRNLSYQDHTTYYMTSPCNRNRTHLQTSVCPRVVNHISRSQCSSRFAYSHLRGSP